MGDSSHRCSSCFVCNACVLSQVSVDQLATVSVLSHVTRNAQASIHWAVDAHCLTMLDVSLKHSSESTQCTAKVLQSYWRVCYRLMSVMNPAFFLFEKNRAVCSEMID
jgi:hypothetical protein